MTDHKLYEDALKDALECAKEAIKKRDSEISELRGALKVCIKELMYTSTTGHLWMWGRSGNTAVPEKLLKARKLIEDELNKPEK